MQPRPVWAIGAWRGDQRGLQTPRRRFRSGSARQRDHPRWAGCQRVRGRPISADADLSLTAGPHRIEAYHTGEQALDGNPYRTRSRPYEHRG